MITKWHKCYESGWKDIITPASFQHPAKMSYSLLKRILAHAKEQGWLKEGDVCVDPFGGIGSTGILGAYEGYQCVMIELEAKFVKLAEQNFKLHDKAWQKFGNPRPIIIQGDSRQLCQIVEKADCIISSPPFQESLNSQDIDFIRNRLTTGPAGSTKLRGKGGAKSDGQIYGQTPGQLGAMKPGNVDMVVSSPPYAESLKGSGADAARKRISEGKYKGQRPDVWTSKGNIAGSTYGDGYGKSNGNLGNLKSGDVDCVLGSPPYEGSIQTDGDGIDWSKIKEGGTNKTLARAAVGTGYGKTKGQLAEEQGDTFWSAAFEIVQQCHQILKPGGHAIWVVKSFVRKGKIVDFPGDWQRLCESVGFKTVCVHHAMLVKEEVKMGLFGNILYDCNESKSFFRRLLETKYSYNKYWGTLNRIQKAHFLKEGKIDCWNSYNILSDEEKAEMLDDGIPKHPKPNKKTILSNAKCIAFIASGEQIRDWNKEIRIDYEVVLCMTKMNK